MPGTEAKTANGDLWYLEGLTEESGQVRRIPVLFFPFEVGRRAGLGLTLVSTMVSQRHAVLDRKGRGLTIRDLGSTNGTFVNGERLTADHRISEGDIIHIARFEFRLGRVGQEEAEALLASTISISDELPQLMIDKSRALRELMRRRDVLSVFQPIVELADERVIGYEVLGRGLLEGAHAASSELFDTAELLGAEAELSRLFRTRSIEDCRALPGDPLFFINTHPKEIGSNGLVESLRDFRRQAPELRAVLEIHESAVADTPMIRRIRDLLLELDIGLAYDDFGAGQARLKEIADIQPDYLKFDIGLIRDIDTASASRRRVLGSLVELALDLAIEPIAEGIESEAEAAICRDVGFSLGQGFLYGAPLSADELIAKAQTP